MTVINWGKVCSVLTNCISDLKFQGHRLIGSISAVKTRAPVLGGLCHCLTELYFNLGPVYMISLSRDKMRGGIILMY